MNRLHLPRIRMDASPAGLKFAAPAGAIARWDKAIAMATKPAAGEIAVLGFIGDEENTVAGIRKQLKAIGRGDVRLILSSPGGNAIEGIGIFNELNDHPGRVTVVVRSMAASAASVIAMAGDRIEMGEAAMMMIHGAAGMVMGNSADMLEFAEVLTMINREVAALYARRTKLPIADILEMMSKDTYLTASQAVEKGFADVAVAEPPKDKKTGANVRQSLPAIPMGQLLAASGNVQESIRLSANLAGVTANQSKVTQMSTITEQYQALVDARAALMSRQAEIHARLSSGAADLQDAERQEFDGIELQLGKMGDDIRIKGFEMRQAQAALPISAPAYQRGAPMLNLKADVEDKFKGQSWTRQVIAMALGHNFSMNPIEIAMHRWGRTNPGLIEVMKMKQSAQFRMAGVPGFGSGSGEPGSELVTADNRYTGDFIEFLYAMTVFDMLPLREVPANVQIKGTDGAATANWIGESKAIKPTTGSASSINLTPLKVAALAVVSNELLADSSPAAEQWIRDLLAEAMSQRVDQTFLSADAASAGVSPAGILNGVSAKTSAGNTADNVRTDIEVLMGDFIAARNTGNLVFVTSQGLGLALQLMRNALGQREFDGVKLKGGTLEGLGLVTGDNVGSGDFILLSPRDIWKIGDSGVQVSISKEATIEQDTAPTGATDTPTAASATLTNMFQEDSTAIRLIRRINFQKRRSTAVSFVGDAGYGGVAS